MKSLPSSQPFALGIHSTHSLLARLTSPNFFKTLASAGGIYCCMLSAEFTLIGLQTATINPFSMLSPMRDEQIEAKARELRFVPKGFDDGAKLTRIIPTPLLHGLAKRTDAVAIYGPFGLFGDTRNEAAMTFLTDRESNPDEVYSLATTNALSKVLRSVPIDPNNYWRVDRWDNSLMLLAVWLMFQSGQSWLWRSASRPFLKSKLDKANSLKRVKASPGSPVEANVYAIAYNWSEVFPLICFGTVLFLSYLLELSLNGAAVSKDIPKTMQMVFKLMALGGFETSLMLTPFFSEMEPSKND